MAVRGLVDLLFDLLNGKINAQWVAFKDSSRRELKLQGRFVNPDNSAFQVALNSRIYVDKTGLINLPIAFLMDGYIAIVVLGEIWKVISANMLAYYSKGLRLPEKMFSGLEI